MYQNPASQDRDGTNAGGDPSRPADPKKVQEEFDEFYEEVYDELAGYGEIEELNVCENLGDHMVGNAYCKFADEEHSDAALKALFGRFYAGRPLVCEFSPVTDFREARCRQYDEAVCTAAATATSCTSGRRRARSARTSRSATRRSGARRARSASARSAARERVVERRRRVARARAAARAAPATRARRRTAARSRSRDKEKAERAEIPSTPAARTEQAPAGGNYVTLTVPQ